DHGVNTRSWRIEGWASSRNAQMIVKIRPMKAAVRPMMAKAAASGGEEEAEIAINAAAPLAASAKPPTATAMITGLRSFIGASPLIFIKINGACRLQTMPVFFTGAG